MAYRMACEASDIVTSIAGLAGASWADPEDCGEPGPVSVLHAHGTWDDSIRYNGRRATPGDPEAVLDIPSCQAAECPAAATACDNNIGCATMWGCMHACGWHSAAADCRHICYLQQDVTSRVLWVDDQRCSLGAGCFDEPSEASAGYSGAEENIERWRSRNGCEGEARGAEALDFVRILPGVDTTPTVYDDCEQGTNVTLWKITRGGHAPGFWPAFGTTIMDWLTSHPRGE